MDTLWKSANRELFISPTGTTIGSCKRSAEYLLPRQSLIENDNQSGFKETNRTWMKWWLLQKLQVFLGWLNIRKQIRVFTLKSHFHSFAQSCLVTGVMVSVYCLQCCTS